MTFNTQPVVQVLDRIEHHPRLDILCGEFDSAIAKAFRGDVRSVSYLLRKGADSVAPNEVRLALKQLRRRYLVVPSEFQDLMDQALDEIERMGEPVEPSTVAGSSATLLAGDEELVDLT